ncbi:MAG: LacI family DNA-binding transcriptional regulator [Sedimentisphaeraceae bacterium JB056]
MKSNVKMVDIARELGISLSTVSRALSDSPLINVETKKKVKELSCQLGFRADLTARSIITKKSNIIGCLVYSLSYNNPLASILEMVQEHIKTQNHELFIVSGSNDLKLQSYLVDKMLSRRVDGMILVPPFILPNARYEPLDMVMQAGVPCTVFGYYANCPTNQVCVDLFSTGYSIGSHLTGLGHKKIATVYLIDNDPRISGMKKALSEHDIELDDNFYIKRKLLKSRDLWAESDCSDLCRKILKSGATAIFVDSDSVAVDIVTNLKKIGIKIPEQIAVATAGDSLPLDILNPALTSYQWPYEVLAEKLSDVIMDAVQTPSAPTKHIFLPGTLAVRQSTDLRLSK